MSSVTSITPSAALCVAGTTAATIAGVGLTGATGVRFVGVEHPLDSFDALAPVVLSPTSISCTIPGSRRTQHYNVVVHLPGGDVTLASGFSIGGSPTFVAWRMDGTARAWYYNLLSTAGGQKIQLQGSWLDETTQVYVGGVLCTGLGLGPYVDTYGGGRVLTCTAPANASGVVASVQVVSRYGTVTVAGQFVYGDPPRIDRMGKSDQVASSGVTLNTGNVTVKAGGRIGLALNGAHFTGFMNAWIGGVKVSGATQMNQAGGGKSDAVILLRLPPLSVASGTIVALAVAVENQYGVGVSPVYLVVAGLGYEDWTGGAWYPDHCEVRVPAKYGGSRFVIGTIGNVTEPLIISGRQPAPGTPLYGYNEMWVHVDPITGVEYNIDPQYDSALGLPPVQGWRGAFTFDDPAISPACPAPTAITPTWDWVEGGVACRIDGFNFVNGGAYQVLFGKYDIATGAWSPDTVAATSFVLVDDHTITCVDPVHGAGVVDVGIVGTVGVGVLPNGFTYRAHPRRPPLLFVHT